MAAAKAFLLMFLLLVSLALIPYETAAGRDLLEVKYKALGYITPGALSPNTVPASGPGKPYDPNPRSRCHTVYCGSRNPGPPRAPYTVPGKPYRRGCDRYNGCSQAPHGSPRGP